MGYAKSLLYIGEIFCVGYAKSLLYNRGDILWGTQSLSYIIGEIFCVGYVKFLLYNRGKHHGVGVRYKYARFPIYIGEIMHTPTQNLSYIAWECVSN